MLVLGCSHSGSLFTNEEQEVVCGGGGGGFIIVFCQIKLPYMAY